jgi:hypothetical protein
MMDLYPAALMFQAKRGHLRPPQQEWEREVLAAVARSPRPSGRRGLFRFRRSGERGPAAVAD